MYTYTYVHTQLRTPVKIRLIIIFALVTHFLDSGRNPFLEATEHALLPTCAFPALLIDHFPGDSLLGEARRESCQWDSGVLADGSATLSPVFVESAGWRTP